MTDFWVSSGHHLVDRDANGRLVVGDALLKAWLARPEIVPPAEACIVERGLHQRLMTMPRQPVTAAEIGDIADRDARENWTHFIAFRDHLLAHSTLEAAYLAYARAPKVSAPPLFLNQLVHLVLRNILDDERDPYVLRAAELMFRAQRLSNENGVILLADQEVVDGISGNEPATPLIAIFGDARAKSLDVLNAENGAAYLGRSDAFDMAIDFRHGGPARDAFARVLERWVAALLGVVVRIESVERIVDESWSWFVGLDQDATAIGNALWRAEEPPDRGQSRIVALYELTFADSREMRDDVAGEPVSLILAMSPSRIVRVKPQNILAGLPMRSAAGAS
jgi:Family of unknown function (DUF6352)